MPRPAHTVVVVEENHSFTDIIGDRRDAPYLNELAAQGALLTGSYASTHPSQPNYLVLFSGSPQGVRDDSCPHTFPGPDLGSELRAAHLGFAGYSEGLPRTGYTGCRHGAYVRKHAPWVDFGDVPASANRPFSDFPRDYAALPTVSFVVPGLDHDMHDGSVRSGDAWLERNLSGYARWARTHGSLLIVTWDEDDRREGNRIPTIIVGQPVKPGRYAEPVDHFRLLRTLEDAYRLPHAGRTGEVSPIRSPWRGAGRG